MIDDELEEDVVTPGLLDDEDEEDDAPIIPGEEEDEDEEKELAKHGFHEDEEAAPEIGAF